MRRIGDSWKRRGRGGCRLVTVEGTGLEGDEKKWRAREGSGQRGGGRGRREEGRWGGDGKEVEEEDDFAEDGGRQEREHGAVTSGGTGWTLREVWHTSTRRESWLRVGCETEEESSQASW